MMMMMMMNSGLSIQKSPADQWTDIRPWPDVTFISPVPYCLMFITGCLLIMQRYYVCNRETAVSYFYNINVQHNQYAVTLTILLVSLCYIV